MRYLLLLLLPFQAVAACFTHPDTGATYCDSTCPSGSTPQPGTNLCIFTDVVCVPPLLWDGKTCVLGEACEVRIAFHSSDPLRAIPRTSGSCTPEEYRRATIAALVKLLD